MGLLGFGGRQRASDRQAISLDIGTEFVKVIIFEVENGIAHVKGVGRKRQRLTDMQGGSVTDIHGVINNCEAALEIAAKQAGFLPDQVIMGIAGELVKGITTTIKFIRPRSEKKITSEELQEILEKVQVRAHEKAKSLLAWETGQQEIDVRLINAAIVDVMIDGYRVTNPLGFQGKEVQVAVYSAFSPIVHLGALQTIAEELGLDLISVTAEPYAVAKITSPSNASEFSGIFIDIGGGTTDIAVVNNGGLIGTKMFAIGGRAFTKKIMNSLNVSFEEAEELKIRYSTKQISKTVHDKIKNVLDGDLDIWFSGVELTLGQFQNADLLPSKIYLCGGGSSLPDIAQKLRGAMWDKKLPFSKKPFIHYLKPEEVETVKDETKNLTSVQDITPMALANLAIDLVGKERLQEGIFSKIVSSLRA